MQSTKGATGLFGISLTAALAGFIFGFDMVVSSGADKAIQELWQTSPWFHGFFIMSMALWGTVIGSIFGGGPTEKYGRKKKYSPANLFFQMAAAPKRRLLSNPKRKKNKKLKRLFPPLAR